MPAVLPIQNLSGDPEQHYFSDGLTEEMISQLGHLDPRRLGVIARTTAMHYKDTALRADEIGKELGVDYILEGSVRRSADRVRITAQLVQVRDQTYLSAETYDRKLADVLDIQRSVARKIARSMAVELLPEQQAALSRQFTRNTAAHEAYLRGRYFWNRRTEANFARAIECFEQAVREDPGYALAYAGLATAYVTLGLFTGIPPGVARTEAMQAATSALEIDGRLAEAHTALAYAKALFEWDWAGAERGFEEALKFGPSYVTAHHWYGHMLSMMLRFDDAIRQFERTEQLSPGHPPVLSGFGQAYAMKGQRAEARRFLDTLYAMSMDRHVSPYYIACVHVRLGETDQALARLEDACEQRCPSMALLNVEPSVDPLRRDQRFRSLLQRIGFPVRPEAPARVAGRLRQS
jgi:TolB-like protein/Tfp pilus assembly protein PilF